MTKGSRRDSLNLSNEEKLFVLIAEYVSSDTDEENMTGVLSELLNDGIEWDYFLRLAESHDYLAAAYRFFLDYEILAGLPGQVRVLLENEYLLSQARFAKKESELVEILDALETHGIDVVVFKGIPLAHIFYNDPGIRVSKDIDILIDKAQVESAQQVLGDNGFSLYTGWLKEADWRTYHFHLIYTRGENMDIVIELHWILLDPNKDHEMDCEVVRRQAVSMKIQGRKVETLSQPHALWFACMHLSYKVYLDVRGLAELKRLAAKMDESAWEYVFSWAQETRTLDQLKLAFAISESVFGAYLEESISLRLKPSRFVRTFILSMYYPRGLVWDHVPFLGTHQMVVMLSLRQGFRRKMSFLYNLIFPDRKALYEVYPGKFIETAETRRRFHIKGIYVFLKVIVLTFLMGFLVQSKSLGERMLDPV
ncbi:MAG: nucleotidyltransferase family protein, partial [Candidatus Fermentibacteria bacterium]